MTFSFKMIRTCTILLVTGFMVQMLVLPSCRPRQSKSYQEKLIDTGDPALHAVHSDELKNLMNNLDGLTFSRMPQELGSGQQQKSYLEQTANIADAMAEAARKIPAVSGQLQLQQEEITLFQALSVKLEKQANELSNLARAGETRLARDQFAAITVTCNACHSAFRLTEE